MTSLLGWVVPNRPIAALDDYVPDSADPLERYRMLLWQLNALWASMESDDDARRLAVILDRFDAGARR